jgi:hypothetical protein
MPDAVLIVEVPSMRVLFSNEYAETFMERGAGRPSNLDMNHLEGEVLRPDGSKYDKSEWPIMRATRGEKVSDERCVYSLPDGPTISISLSAAPILDSDGKIVAAVAIGRDMTEQEGVDSASLNPGL